MQQQELKKLLHLAHPEGRVRMVLDTDTYNEVDDQFAIAYALKSSDRLSVEAIYAAPFYSAPFFPPWNSGPRSQSPADGMERSYQEILRVLALMGRTDLNGRVLRGSKRFMQRDGDPVESEAARDLADRAMAMPEGERLYVAAIGAITNVASAILLEPRIVDKIVVVWLGCHAPHWHHNRAFNFMQDPYAARVIFDSGAPVVQAPGMGVTSHLHTTGPELEAHLKGKNPLCDYLYQITGEWGRVDAACPACWSKTIWDIVTIAWLVGDERWMTTALVHSPVVNDNLTQSTDRTRHFISQILEVNRDFIFEDLFRKLTM